MPLTGMRKINTTFKTPKVGGKQTRIRIPQPIKRPLVLKSRDVIRRELLKPRAEDFILHRRGLLGEKVGIEDPRERRAVPQTQVRGSLPERILYKYLVAYLHLVPDTDDGFDFQSSLDGGRAELGGIVADFLFVTRKMVINVQGPTHEGFLRMRKDEEQRGILENMGYNVYDITDEEIYNEAIFEDKIRRLFNLSGGTGGYSYVHSIEADQTSNDSILLGTIMSSASNLLTKIEVFSG